MHHTLIHSCTIHRCGKLCTAHGLVTDDDGAYDPMAADPDEEPPEPPSLKKKLFMAFGE
jgi:hypothetical protein